MYASTSEQFNHNQNASRPELHGYLDLPCETWWNRSVGPLILTTLLAPVVLTLMASGYVLLGVVTTALSAMDRLQIFSASEQSSAHLDETGLRIRQPKDRTPLSD